MNVYFSHTRSEPSGHWCRSVWAWTHRPHGSPRRFEHLADDIVGLIEHLGLEKADLLGFSLGGAVALQTAIRYPGRVNNLVLISTPSNGLAGIPNIKQVWQPSPLRSFWILPSMRTIGVLRQNQKISLD